MPHLVKLSNGPFDGMSFSVDELPEAEVGLPIDQTGSPTTNQPFGVAIYRKDSGVPCNYSFHHFTPIDNSPLAIEFADGPAADYGKELGKQLTNLPPTIEISLLDDSSIYKMVGNPTAAAVYQLRPDDGRWRYFLVRIDRSETTVARLVAAVNEARAENAIRSFYTAPNYDIYSMKPNGDHVQVPVEVGHRRGHVDEGIAGIIRRIWEMGLDTLGSCQARPKTADHPERAYIGFMMQRHARDFERILLNSGLSCVYEPKKVQIGRRSTQGGDGGIHAEIIELDTANVLFFAADIPAIEAALDALRN